MPQISLQIWRKAAAKSVILGRKNHKKVQQSPGGTDSLPDKLNISPKTVCCDMILHLDCFSFTFQSIGTVLFWPQNYTYENYTEAFRPKGVLNH